MSLARIAPARAQTPSELLARSDSLFLAYRADSALVLARRVVEEGRRARDQTLLLDALIAEGKILATIHRAVPAEAVLREALRLAQARSDRHRAAHALRFLAYALETQGRIPEARERYAALLDAGLALSNPGHEAFGRLGLAYCDLVRGRPADAAPNYERAARLFRASPYLAASETLALIGLSRCHAGLGRVEEQRRCLELVVERARAGGDPYQEGHAWNNLGCLEFEVGDPALSIEHFQRAIALFERGGRDADPRGWIGPTLSLAHANLYLSRIREASQTLDAALATCRRERFRGEESEVLSLLAEVRRAAGDDEGAIDCERECLALAAAVPASTRARVTASLARALASAGRTGEAQDLLEREMARWSGVEPTVEVATLEHATGDVLAAANRLEVALMHWRRADAVAQSFAQTEERVAILTRIARAESERRAFERSRAALEAACVLWEVGRGRSRDPEWRERLGQDARALYSELAARLAEDVAATRPEERARLVFDRLQRFKARTLQERLRGPAMTAAASEARPLRAPVTLREVQAEVLRESELLLDVFLGSDAAYVVAADRNECRLRVLADPKGEDLARFSRWISLVAGSAGAPPEENGVSDLGPASALGRTLLEGLDDLLRRNRRILFSPDAEWHRLPLGALAWPDSSGRPVPLAATHEVVRIPSATLLAELRARGAARRAGAVSARSPLLAVAGGGASGEPRLPGAVREVRSLARRYEHVVGSAASTSAWSLEQLGRARVIHFASHTRLDDERPWRSALLLVGSGRGAEGRVEAAQVAGLALDADLAVLSACETAGGRVVSGEGVLGLSSAFLSAGVPSVVATLWPVRDRVATRFVAAFYDALARGESAASALRTAQAGLRADPRSRAPFDWAGFVLLGEGDTCVRLSRRPTRSASWLGVLGVAGLAAAGAAFRRASPREPSRSPEPV